MPHDPTRVLFVCLGNICRSPLAKVIFEDMVARHRMTNQVVIDSCGTGQWHIGKPADPRSIEVANRHGLNLVHTARQLAPDTDFEGFDLLLGMDQSNCSTMLEWGAPREKVKLMRSFDPHSQTRPEHMLDVPDPYLGSDDGFERVFQMLSNACEGLLEDIKRRQS